MEVQKLECKSCGAPLNKDSLKCEYCGTEYQKNEIAGKELSNQVENENFGDYFKLFVLIAGTIFIMAFIGVGIVFGVKNREEKVNTEHVYEEVIVENEQTSPVKNQADSEEVTPEMANSETSELEVILEELIGGMINLIYRLMAMTLMLSILSIGIRLVLSNHNQF